ncbi:MAG: acetyl ornithine aminotransferase family protein [Planctomycetes bacterium]|nr:acetyl ornithine aminotransferase family protein [Planctomycetota bacterium]
MAEQRLASPSPVPELHGPVPGPRARAVLEKDRRAVSPSYTRSYPLVARRGRGLVLEDEDGNRFLDFTAGIAVTSTGHCHPRVVEAIQRQAAELIHMSGTDFYYAVQADLAERLARIAPGRGAKRVFLTNSGTEAVEAAFKLARWRTRRPRALAFIGAFHGRTMGALSLTNSKVIQRAGFAPLLSGVTHVPFPNPYRGPEAAWVLDFIRRTVLRRTVPPEEVAAIFVEPVQGEGGYVVPPLEFHQGLRAIADEIGALLVHDEVQSGMGRTGRMFASEHFGVAPDVVCLAKGIASGMPLGACIAREEVMAWPPGAHASTFGGNPVSCAAALATLDLLEAELVENARVVGAHLEGLLRGLARDEPSIGDVRGLGLMLAVELVRPGEGSPPDGARAGRVIDECFRRGLLLLPCGESGIRFCPALVARREDCDRAVEVFAGALAATPE